MNKFIVALIAFILVASSFSMKIRSTESDTSENDNQNIFGDAWTCIKQCIADSANSDSRTQVSSGGVGIKDCRLALTSINRLQDEENNECVIRGKLVFETKFYEKF